MNDKKPTLNPEQLQMVLAMLDAEATFCALMHRIGARRLFSHGLVF